MSAQVTSATAITARKVRVVFDVACVDATPIDVAAWTLTPTGTGPFYTPTIVSVVGVDSDTLPAVVDITADQDLTPGALYRALCLGVTGVAEDGAHNAALFWGLTPGAPADRDYSIIDIIPPINVNEDTSNDLGNFVACLQEIATILWSDVDRWGNIFDIDKSPDNFVDVILAELGNPVEVPELSVQEKRRLCSLLVAIYKIKGSIPGLVAAIKFFVGLPAQVANFYGMGFVLGDGVLAHGDYPGAGGGDPGTWILGGGDPWAFTVKCGTASGGALTAPQILRVTEIVDKTRPSISHIAQLAASYVASARLDIHDNGAGSVTLTCSSMGGPSAYQTFWRNQPGVNEWNGAVLALAGAGPAAATLTPGSTRYWRACDNNAGTGVPGLLSNEVTNALAAPVLSIAAQSRNLHLSWPAVTGATSYRLYKSLAAHGHPSATDNASNPIRVEGVTYDDPMETGITFYYVVVPMIGDSEGFYSNEVHATST
jgi:phage tail-like protein